MSIIKRVEKHTPKHLGLTLPEPVMDMLKAYEKFTGQKRAHIVTELLKNEFATSEEFMQAVRNQPGASLVREPAKARKVRSSSVAA